MKTNYNNFTALSFIEERFGRKAAKAVRMELKNLPTNYTTTTTPKAA